jgi:hypothetical protein
MADKQQTGSAPGTAGKGDGEPRPREAKPAVPDRKANEDRPGSDPKNPGDFGHH